jgi:DNA-binding CsgD family transcriptional regulator
VVAPELRRTDARVQLRLAHAMLEALGMDAFAERARHELLATGETARKRTPADGVEQLTPQEAQIARLARDGTVEPRDRGPALPQCPHRPVHLRRVFSKLGISSRSQLQNVMTN